MSSPSRRMRALVYDAPAADASMTRVAELDVPAPGPGEVTIRVTHAGVNFKDIMARRGDPGYVSAWPFVPGLEVAGVVHAVGAGVDGLSAGQRVTAFTGDGGLAEFVRADSRHTVVTPDGLGDEVAAAATGVLVSAAVLVDDLGRLRAGETVLVHGAAGGVGHAVAQYARLRGAGRLLGTVGGSARADAARHAGYDAVATRGPDLVSDIRAAAGDPGVDLIFDPQGTTLLDVDLAVAAPGARIVLFGNAAGTPLDALPPLGSLMSGLLSVTGFSLAALAAGDPAWLHATLGRVLADLASGAVTLHVTLVDGLVAAADAQQALAEGRGASKFVVAVG
jgi:NADPH2:quinone reductase